MAKIDFEFYNDGKTNHEILFTEQVKAKCPQYLPNIANLKVGIDVDKMEFYTFALFEDFNSKNPKLSSFQDFESYAIDSCKSLDRVFDISDTIKFHYKGNTPTHIAYGGCGGALCISNRLFDLTNADYVRIPEKRGRPKEGEPAGKNKTLDFEYKASDGNLFFLVECKGKEGNDGKISSKADSIIKKKSALRVTGNRDLAFGIINVIPVSPYIANAKCILVDPEIPDFIDDPILFKLIARLKYYTQRLGFFGNTRWLKQIRNVLFDTDNVLRSFSGKNIGNETITKLFNIDYKREFTSSYHFKLSILYTEKGERAFVRFSELPYKKGVYFVYGLMDAFFTTLQSEPTSDFLKFKFESQSIELNDNIMIWDGYLSKIETRLRGRLILTSTGELTGFLNSVQQ